MLPENAIEVKNIKKSFKVYLDKGNQLKERALFKNRNRYEERVVLNGISFSVEKGEAIGLIGNNGCGKSTTLKLLTKIIYPDSGTIDMRGRISSLIELGAGFHPDMSGRENIYINAAIFGLTKKEIEDRLESIIAFSELEQFIDNPVRTYSSGMYMRLAFSVAINVDADILLIDEILAVGDAAFQAKCFNRLREIKAAGTTIVIVSHSTAQIEQICDRVVWIRGGEIARSGAAREVIQEYMSWIMGAGSSEESACVSLDSSADTGKSEETEAGECEESGGSGDRGTAEKSGETEGQPDPDEISRLRSSGALSEVGNGDVKILNYSVSDVKTNAPKTSFAVSDGVRVRMEYVRNNAAVEKMMCSIAIYRSDGILCYTTNSLIDTGEELTVSDRGEIEFVLEKVQLMQGEYTMDLALSVDYGPIYHGVLNAIRFSVYNARTDYGVFRPGISWRFSEKQSLKGEKHV